MKHVLILALIIICYILSLIILKPNIFSYKFNPNLVEQYLCSQDRPQQSSCKGNYVLSDGDLHIAAGYLYTSTGADPTEYHFQHTPFIKYLYGWTIQLTQNPFWLEIAFGIAYLVLSYILSFKLFHSYLISTIATALLLLDPLFIALSGDTSLELGQATFLLAYVISVLYKKNAFVLQGVLLGLAASSKFWGAVPFFIFSLYGYSWLKKEFKWRPFLLHLLVGFVAFSLTYFRTFILDKGLFNIFFFQLKLLKYWLQHSVTNIPFASVIMFLTGHYKSWWDTKSIVKSDVWSPLWLITFIVALQRLITFFKKKAITKELFVAFLPVAYLFYLGTQAPFSRYFILILPFLYILSVQTVVKRFMPSHSRDIV